MGSSTPSWSRYGSQRRICARAGCNAPAVATLRFQSTERRAWLAELDDSAVRTQGDLCQRHAAALVLPRGWELHDERPFAAAGTAAPPRDATPIGPAETEAASLAVTEPIELVEVVDEAEVASAPSMPEVVEVVEPVVADAPDELVEPEPGTEPAVANANGNGAGPVLGVPDDDAVEEALDSILDARTPLLQRAFRNARPGA
jgi:hypothetical protein